VLTTTPFDKDELDEAWAQPPDWLDLGPGYTQSLDYVYNWVGGYLKLRHDRDFVVILIGDHQPPAMVSGEDASWEVPVHVVTSRRAVLDRLRARGFHTGLAPAQPSLGMINELMPTLLTAFSSDAGTADER
jgi:hypothetical protein